MHEDPDMRLGVPHNRLEEVVKGSFLVFGPRRAKATRARNPDRTGDAEGQEGQNARR